MGHAVLSDNDPLTFALCREMFSTVVLLGLAQAKEGDLAIKSKSDLIDVFVLVRSGARMHVFRVRTRADFSVEHNPVVSKWLHACCC